MNDKPQSGYAKVDTWIDIVKLEHEILAFWAESRAFDKLREKNAGKPPYSFLDGPITANNPMGVHHAWGRTLKDAYQRYWAMNGRDQRWQNGFDCQGLWVEVEVEKEHGLKTKRDIEAYGIERFVNECKARVRKFSRRQTAQSIRLGMWMDWGDWDKEDWDENNATERPHSYFTMTAENNYTIWAFLKKCHQRGKIYRGTDVMPWSGRTGAAYSQMEVVEGRKLVAHTAIFLRFPLRERPGENLLVWTTTPWTLTSNVAAAVNVELDYVKIKTKRDGLVYYLAAENLNFARLDRQFKEKKEWVDGVPKLKTLAQIFNERGGFEIIGQVKGADLVGLTYEGPFDELEGQQVAGGYPFTDDNIPLSARDAHRVIDGGRDSQGNPTVVAGEGTGIVHTAPGCGDIDHVIGKQQGLPAVSPLDEQAQFIDKFGPLTGKHALAKETVQWVIDSLAAKGFLIATEQYPHVYPHCWRTGDELVFRVVDEWYINMDWRDEIIKTVASIRWIPEWGGEREVEWLTNMRDWMISKKRYWGLALPIWVCEKCDHFDVLGSRDELKSRAVAGWTEFEGHSPHRPWIDHVKIKCEKCGGLAHRVPDVGNPWLDAGIVPSSTAGYNSDRDYWQKWIPADLVLECFPGQFRNWFYALLSMSAMMEGGPGGKIAGRGPFKTLLGHALVRDEHGKEMHKSAGNAIWFDDAAEQAGADTMRWLYCSHEPTVNLNFGFTPLREVRGRFINTLWNTYAFFVNYARLADFVPWPTFTKPTVMEVYQLDTCPAFKFDELSEDDRWILSELHEAIAACRSSIEEYNMREATIAIERFLEKLSNSYIRENRPRFWMTRAMDTSARKDSRAAFFTLYECLWTLTRLAAPMLPFITESIYQNLVRTFDRDAPTSVHHTNYPTPNGDRFDRRLIEEREVYDQIKSLALGGRGSKKIKTRQPLRSLTIGPATKLEDQIARRTIEKLKDEINVKYIAVEPAGTPLPFDFAVAVKGKLPVTLGRIQKSVLAELTNARRDVLAQLSRSESHVQVNVEGENVSIDRQLIRIFPESDDSHARAIAPNGTWVEFDTVLTPELKIEGLMRDVLRRLQVLRKDTGLEVEDRITLAWNSSDAELRQVFADWQKVLADELLCVDMKNDPSLGGEALNIEGHELFAKVTKA